MRRLTQHSTTTFIVVFGVLLTVMLFMQWQLQVGLIDDAYIFFRYADNFHQGHGLVFNPGERVEGYSSLLWVFWLSVLAPLGLPLEIIAQASGLLLGLSTVLLFVYAGQEEVTGNWRLLIIPPAWLLITNPSLGFWVSSGMDTALFMFLFFLTYLIFCRELRGSRSMVWSGICFSIAVLARLEMLVLLPIYLSWLFFLGPRERQLLVFRFWSFLAPQVLLLLSFIWRYSYYGALLPNTYHAKADMPVEILLGRGLTYTLAFAKVYWPLLVCAFLALILAMRSPGGRRPQLALAVAVIFVWSGYVTYVGGDHFPMFRFFTPIVPILALLLMSFLALLVGKLGPPRPYLVGITALAACILASLLNYQSYHFELEGLRMRANIKLTSNWVEVGHWLRRNVDKDSTIASIVVGAIPYYSGLGTIDLLGLTDREIAIKGNVLREAEVGHQKYNTDYVLSRAPDYIIYNSSGQYLEPIYRDPHKISTRYAYALHNIALDERTKDLYQYHAVRIENGRIVEFLRRKSSSR